MISWVKLLVFVNLGLANDSTSIGVADVTPILLAQIPESRQHFVHLPYLTFPISSPFRQSIHASTRTFLICIEQPGPRRIFF